MPTYQNTINYNERLRIELSDHYLIDESKAINNLLSSFTLTSLQRIAVTKNAIDLITRIRQDKEDRSGIESFIHTYSLSTQEGVVLMCIAEALLRIPDEETIDKLISDKLSTLHWDQYVGQSESLFINAATWGLMLGEKIISLGNIEEQSPQTFVNHLINKSGVSLIRMAIKEAMRILAHQFVIGESIESAMKLCTKDEKIFNNYSFDMLGEEALSKADAHSYFSAYVNAISVIAEKSDTTLDINKQHGISIKLSALHPRFDYMQRDRVLKELTPRIIELSELAAQYNINLTIDAEESERLDLTLDIFALVYKHNVLHNWNGLGIAVQSYQKRAPVVIDWLHDLAQSKQQIHVRLVKGAYWDTEIKRAQQSGLSGYPVFTRKACTDISYLACAEKLLATKGILFPQFATHNAHTACAILEMVNNDNFEFQRLYGMGNRLYKHLQSISKRQIHCRVYAPVGCYSDLLPYLVRRLLENGANTSFVNQIDDVEIAATSLAQDPIQYLESCKSIPHPRIPLPENLYKPLRDNSRGLNLYQSTTRSQLNSDFNAALDTCKPSKELKNKDYTRIYSPHDYADLVGYAKAYTQDDVEHAFEVAHQAFPDWAGRTIDERTSILEKAGDLFEQKKSIFIDLIVREGGRTIVDAIAEVRETIDFCYYYAQSARATLTKTSLPNVTGEENTLYYKARGVTACISPWNFPLAIFCGQILAALVTGNTVVAKPASATPLTAIRAREILIEAGIPEQVFQLVTGNSRVIADPLLSSSYLAAVVFTGSTDTANLINETLAKRRGTIIPLLAETGGINCMIADSSALPQQLVSDVIQSAFNSAGQRCSALRVLFIQDDIADKVIKMLKGAMAELEIGLPTDFKTDVACLIDEQAKNICLDYKQSLKRKATLIYECDFPSHLNSGHFVSPAVFEISNLSELSHEVFAPILHVIRYSFNDLDKVIDSINQSNFGLTLGIHSRLNSTINKITETAHVGNIYVNRDIIGATVGAQPFGGEGLSGTGPKAGGPNYLHHFVHEHVTTINTVSMGGNVTLLSLDD